MSRRLARLLDPARTSKPNSWFSCAVVLSVCLSACNSGSDRRQSGSKESPPSRQATAGNSERSTDAEQRDNTTDRQSPHKPHVHIGAIGHAGHGKTMLTTAILAVQSKQHLAKAKSYDEIASAPIVRDTTNTISIAISHVEFETTNHHYALIDLPEHSDIVKNLITGAAQLDVAVLVVSAADGPMPQTREHIQLASQVGVPAIVVFLNKVDLVDDPELLDLIELEIRELLNKYEFPGDDVTFVRGSSLAAFQHPEEPQAAKCIHELLEALDSAVPLPIRQEEKPFLMPVEDVFSIEGRGTVVTGRIERGTVRVGDKLEIVGLSDTSRKSTCGGVETFRKLLDAGKAGDNVGILLRGIQRDEVQRGQVLAKPGSMTSHTKFEAEVYCLSTDEGGRHTPFFSGYRPQFCFRTTDVTGIANLVDAEMCMPGDHVTLNVEMNTPIAMHKGLRFAIREGGSTVGAGVVTKISD